ncbi:asparaginase [Scandinavium sp. H11S7]|uniref:asparaginase domain-containing protein n=1 Tax=Scandinavium TaxID=2726810 RepID=UPI00135AA694|nr:MULTISPECIES: asparaginase domain-containing protein [Scandinavium]MCS2146789.1 asparaginase [Scandinavium manionii]MCS2155407.1 asparaginase [Scandinavium hiltneri]MCS2168781.1 asparaginase [Scandinavium tedordense]
MILEKKDNASAFRIAVIMTGGTIAKTYDPHSASMCNSEVTIDALIRSLRLPNTHINFIDLMRKDSLEINPEDRTAITESVLMASHNNDAVIVTHGTDTLANTGEELYISLPGPTVPIIFTGAMIPLVVQQSDGIQNIIEAILACKLLPVGIYTIFHGQVLSFPGIIKDRKQMTFVRSMTL